MLHAPTDVTKVGQAHASESPSTPQSIPAAPDAGAAPSQPSGAMKVAIDRMTDFDPAMFKGVDTLVVADGFSPTTQQVLSVTSKDTMSAMTGEVQKLFSDASKRYPVSAVRIKPLRENSEQLEVEYLRKSNVLLVTFVLSARREMIAGKPVKVAALTWAIGKYASRDSFAQGQGIAYPFVVSDSKQEQVQRIRDGVAYMASALPSYFGCANSEIPTTLCNFDKPYRETP
jgi:hypothetical protein